MTTSFLGSSLFLPRERTLVTSGHEAPKIWVLNKNFEVGGVTLEIIVAMTKITVSWTERCLLRSSLSRCQQQKKLSRTMYQVPVGSVELSLIVIIVKTIFTSEILSFFPWRRKFVAACLEKFSSRLCRPYKRRLTNFKSFQQVIRASQTSVEMRLKRVIEMSPSAPGSQELKDT